MDTHKFLNRALLHFATSGTPLECWLAVQGLPAGWAVYFEKNSRRYGCQTNANLHTFAPCCVPIFMDDHGTRDPPR